MVKEGAGGAPVIDITSLFTTNPPSGFALEFKRHYRMARVDGRRSLVRGVQAFPENITFGFYQTWIPDEQDLLKPPEGQDPPPPALGFSFKTNLLLLPEKPMVGRCEDERVGYFSHSLQRLQHQRASRRQQSLHHSLPSGEKGPRAAVSEPVRPIVFYLKPRDSRQMASLSQAGGGGVARSSGAGGIQERHLRQGCAYQRGRPRLGSGRSALGDPLGAGAA